MVRVVSDQYISAKFLRADSLGEQNVIPPADAFFGVPAPMLNVEYWKLKTNIPFGWVTESPIYWCANTDTDAIKKKVIEKNIALVESFIAHSEARTLEYQQNPALLKIEAVRNTPMSMRFMYAQPNADKSGIVGQYAADFNVAPRFALMLEQFYTANGRLPTVILDDYAGEPRLLQNDPRGTNPPRLQGISAPPTEYRFESDGFGIKCPTWAFFGACQVDGIVKLTDGGPRFVSDAAYFQFQFSLWAQCAPFTGVYKPSNGVRREVHLPEKAGMTSYGQQDVYRSAGGEIPIVPNTLPIDYIGFDLINFYSPMYGFSNTPVAGVPNSDIVRWHTHSAYFQPGCTYKTFADLRTRMTLEAYAKLHGLTIDVSGVTSGEVKMCPPGYAEVYFHPVYAYRRYLTICVPVLQSVAEKVGARYREILDKANAQAWEMRRAGDKADVMGLVGFVFSAIGMFFGVQAVSGLFGGNLSVANLSGTLKLTEKFGVDTGGLSTLLSFGNNLYSLGTKALNGIASLTQADINADGAEVFDPSNWETDFDATAPTWPEDLPTEGPTIPDVDTPINLPEDTDMWDDFTSDPWGDLDTSYAPDWSGWYADDSWYDQWGSSMEEWAPGYDEWYSVDYGFSADELADVSPGLTPTQVAVANGATAEQVAEINAISSQAAQSTDYWATFQNLLKNASQAAMQIGGLVMQYKQAELAFDKLKGGNTAALPTRVTRPTQVGVPVRQPDGSISTLNPDGSITTIRPNGQQVQTAPGGQLPSFARFLTPKNLMIGGAVVGMGVLGYFALRNSGGSRRRR